MSNEPVINIVDRITGVREKARAKVHFSKFLHLISTLNYQGTLF